MDIIEILGYFLGFWLFLFSKKFRDIIINDWQVAGFIGKFFIILGAVSSFVCGVVGPIWLIKSLIE